MNALSKLDLTRIVSITAIRKLLALKLEQLHAFCVPVVQNMTLQLVQNMALQLEVIRTAKLNQIMNGHINVKKITNKIV